jgi:hypothetical protein
MTILLSPVDKATMALPGSSIVRYKESDLCAHVMGAVLVVMIGIESVTTD